MKYIEKYKRYIDNDGVIYRMNSKGKLVQVKPSINNCGYEFICYAAKSVVFVHRLVYEAFKGEIPKGLEIDHIDRNKHNNNPDNLRVVTRLENIQNRSTDKEFGKKFREHYGFNLAINISIHPDYIKEKAWYYRHNRKCRWE